MISTILTKKRLMALVAAGCVTLVGAAAADNAAEASRYPYDPVCSWGRIADGRGMLVRCLGERESKSLAATPTPAGVTLAPPVPSFSAEVPPAPGERSGVEVDVGPVVTDSGKLPEAVKKLKLAKDRFKKCVNYQGALTQPNAEVKVRFLVRERGLAEGVSVAGRSGVTAKAARCVADVVDRRNVGAPEEPMVGATVVIKFTRPGA